MSKKHQPLQNRIEDWTIRMRKARINQKNLAKLSGISETQLSNIIRGHTKNPKMSTIDKIEQVLEAKGV